MPNSIDTFPLTPVNLTSRHRQWVFLKGEGYVLSLYDHDRHSGSVFVRFGERRAKTEARAIQNIATATSLRIITKPNMFLTLNQFYTALERIFGRHIFLPWARIVRIDYNIDIPVSFEDVLGSLSIAYKQVTSNIGTRGNPRTHYFGSMKSAEVIRVYDKRAEIERHRPFRRRQMMQNLRVDGRHVTRMEVSWQQERFITKKMEDAGFANNLGNLRAYLASFHFAARNGDIDAPLIAECPFKQFSMWDLEELFDPSRYVGQPLTANMIGLIQQLAEARTYRTVLGMHDYYKRAVCSRGERTQQHLHVNTVRFRRNPDHAVDPAMVFMNGRDQFLAA